MDFYIRIVSDVVTAAWCLIMTIALFKLWDRVHSIPDDQDKPVEPDESWEPVDMSDERDLHLDRTRRNRWDV